MNRQDWVEGISYILVSLVISVVTIAASVYVGVWAYYLMGKFLPMPKL